MSQQQIAFVRSLTRGEKKYLWDHVFRYAGVEDTTTKEQFAQIIMYVLNFLTGDSDIRNSFLIEKRIHAKAMAMFG